jgi:hypothetical protein
LTLVKLAAGVLTGALAGCALAAGSVAHASPPRSFFGVAPQGPLWLADYARMAEAKVGTLRFELSWAQTSPEAGIYDWRAADAMVENAAVAGMRPLPFLFSTPAWVARLDGYECEEAECLPYPPHGPAAMRAWREFATAVADRYGPGGAFWRLHPSLHARPIRVWQIWNEQNSPTFFKPKPSPAAYGKLLRVAHDAITVVDADATIVLGGMFGTPLGGHRPAMTAWRYLGQLYDVDGAAAAFDGVAPHPYAQQISGMREQINRIRDRMAQARDTDSKLWITELGWASAGVPSPLNRGVAGQARRLRQAFGYLLEHRRRLRIANVDWYSWRDEPSAGGAIGLCAWCPSSGLVEEDMSAKPSLDAFAGFTGGS